MPESITITDNRTGESVEVPIEDGGINSAEWAKLMPGLWFKDEGLATTAMTNSAITFIDGDAGVLEYRGYPIEQLAEQSTFLEVAYLLVHGELPSQEELDSWVHEITTHTFIHENFRKRMFDAFHYDAHPMGMLTSGMAALSTFYPEAKEIEDPANRMQQIIRVIAKIPTLAAGAYRKSLGMPFIFPDNDLSYTENFLSMMFRIAEPQFAADPVLARALDVLFILHADHEQNCSTTATRVVGSSHADPYSAVSAGCAALYGPRHGGANEAVLAMLDEIGTFDNVDAFVESVKNGEGRLMGLPPGVQELRPACSDHQKDRRRGVRGHRAESSTGHRHRVGAHRAGRRLLRQAEALPQRRFLFRHHLPGDGLPGRDVSGAVRHSAHSRLAGAVAGAATRQRPAHRPSSPDLLRQRGARIPPHVATISWAASLVAVIA